MDGLWRRRVVVIWMVAVTLPIAACGASTPSRSAAPPPVRPTIGPTEMVVATAGGGFAGVLAAAADPPAASPLPLPPCTYGDVPAIKVEFGDWPRTLVDTTFELPGSYVPPDLVPVSRAHVAGSGRIRAIVVDDLRAMARAADHAGAPVGVRSAYRSYRRQAEVFAGWVAISGRDEALRFSARPGHSEHQLGTALDLQAVGGAAPWQVDFAHSRQGRWLARNAWRFGFVISYPPGSEGLTCYGSEAWHIRYVGREMARDVHRSGLTLREWLWRHDD